MGEILVISFSDVSRDSRVDRHIALLGERWNVTVAGYGETARDVPFVSLSSGERLVPRALRTLRIALRRHESAYWQSTEIRRALERLGGLSHDVIVANDVAALPLAVRLAGGRAKVVFDVHEYAAGEFDDYWWWRASFGVQADYFCRRYIPRVDAVTTVSPGIAERYARETGVRPTVLRNAPFYADLEPQTVGDTLRMVHFGWAERTRRLEDMIEMMRFLDGRFTLDFILVQNDAGYMRRLREAAAGNERIRFLPPVAMRDLLAFANGYDIGLYLLNATNFNRSNALPNKFFEFVQARLAVAIGPSPAMAEVAREHGFGIVAPENRPQSLAAALSDLDAGQVWQLKQRAHAAAAELCAEREWARLTALIAGLLGEPAGSVAVDWRGG